LNESERMVEANQKASDPAELVAAYLKQPYARLVIPETDGTFRGEMLEFPGCIATGETPSEALSALEDAAQSWLAAALSRGQHIPEPVDSNEFSGRTVLRLPRSLHKKASRLAEREGVSLNQFILASLAEHVGARAATPNAGWIFLAAPFFSARPDPHAIETATSASALASGGFQRFFVPGDNLIVPLIEQSHA
jgi:antitoxin HicB